MNPEIPGDSDNEVSKQAKRQSRSRREFALMHGFSYTNVGKNRLTVSQETPFGSKLVINITAQTRSSRHWRFSERQSFREDSYSSWKT
jgi:hypothetical protein